MQVFETKLRKVGSSWGALIPNEIVKQEKLEKGKIIQLAVFKKNNKLIDKMFGSAPFASSFKRDHSDRVF